MPRTGAAEPEKSLLNSKETAKQARIERLKKYRWAPGESGNAKGRPKNRAFSDAIARWISRPLTKEQRAQMKKAVAGITESELGAMTMTDLLIYRHITRIIAGPAAPAVSALQALIERMEGKAVQPLSGPEGAPLGADPNVVLIVVNDDEETEASEESKL